MARSISEMAVVATLMMNMGRIVTWADSIYEWDQSGYRRISDTQLRRLLYQSLDDNAAVGLVEASIKHLKGRTSIEAQEMPPRWLEDAPQELRGQTPIAFLNGILLFEHWLAGEPNHFIEPTQHLFAIHPLPYAYDPAAACPEWESFMLWMCSGDASVVTLLQQFLGSVLLGLRLEKVLWMQGDGGNGKSTFIDVVVACFGDAAVGRVNLDELHQPFAKESLLGRRLNICNEFSEISKKTENEIKRIASHESQAVNRKFKEYLHLSLRLSLILVSNALPRLDDQSEGIWRRLLLVKCLAKPQQEDIDFRDRLLPELPGIFNWILSGAKSVASMRRIPVPAAVRGWVDELRLDFDPIRQWLEEFYVVTRLPRDLLPTRPAYESYAEWAEGSGYKPTGAAKFNRRIKDLARVETVRSMRDRRQHNCFAGIANRSELLAEILRGSRSLADLPDKVRERLQVDLSINKESTNEVQRGINRAGSSRAAETVVADDPEIVEEIPAEIVEEEIRALMAELSDDEDT